MSHDAIVIGAGVNGLACAHLLAKAGRRVLVLEQSQEPGAGSDIGWVPPRLAAELGLAARGLQVRHDEPWAAVPLDGGGRLELSQGLATSAEAIRRISPRDAAQWPAFCARMHRLAGVLAELYLQPAPDVETTEAGELLRLGLLGLRVRRMGRQGMIDLLRLLPMSISDVLDEWFEHDALKAALGVAGVMRLRQGARSGGTAFNFLHHHVGAAAGAFRPPRSNIGVVLAALPGVEVRRGATVRRIPVAQGRARGVILADGQEIAAPLVVSSADPRATLLGLLEPGWLDPDVIRAVQSIKCRGVAAEVTLRLDGDAPLRTLTAARSLTHIERAYDDAKYGRISSDPWLEAHGERDRIRVHVQYVPHGAVADGLGDAVLARLTELAPELRGRVTGVDVATPGMLALRDGLTEGQRYHGELTLDQILFMRPIPGWTRYRTPVDGLYLCGAGTHPGGGIQGGSGRLAARQILRDSAT